ncbi:hypothetical protein D3C87_1274520 [compost metagenome]
MVVRLATEASAQATSPTDRMRWNSAPDGRTRSVGTKPAPPRSTTQAMASEAAQDTAASAAPMPARPMPIRSAKYHDSTGNTIHITHSTRAASAWRPPPRSTEASVLVSQAGTAPTPNSQIA